jgi:hypothetical protein
LASAAVSSAALVCLLSGCGTVQPWNLEIAAKTPASIRLDLVGIHRQYRSDWEQKSVDNYWKPEDDLRQNAQRVSLQIERGNINVVEVVGASREGILGDGSPQVTIARTHPIWNLWLNQRNASGIVAIGQFPGGSTEQPDPRKRVISLDKRSWDTQNKTLRLVVRDKSIGVETPPSAKAHKVKF